jgi:hypothetical protein
VICLALGRKVPTTWRGRGTEIQNLALVGTFLNWKQRGVYLVLRKKIKSLFSSLLGLKVVTAQSVVTQSGHTLVYHELSFSPNDSLFWFGCGQFTS